MNKLITTVFVLLALWGCKGEENIVDSNGVSQEWLDARIDEINKSDLKKYFYIVKADYEGRCIVYVNNCCPMCSTIIVPYNCDGTKAENVDTGWLGSQNVIWKPDNFSCSL